MKRALTFMAIMAAGIVAVSLAQWAAFDDHYFAARPAVEAWTPISNLVAHYKMNDNAANTVVTDSKGSINGTNQRNTAAVSVSGKIGGALSFNGTSDYTSLGDNFFYSSNFTFAAWATRTNAWSQSVLMGGGHPGGRFSEAMLARWDWATMGFGWQWYNGVYKYAAATNDLNLGQWYHYAGSYDGQTIRYYVNGVEINSAACTSAPVDTKKAFLIGAVNWPDPGFRWGGVIDDVRIYDRALSSNEVYRIWNNGDGTEAE